MSFLKRLSDAQVPTIPVPSKFFKQPLALVVPTPPYRDSHCEVEPVIRVSIEADRYGRPNRENAYHRRLCNHGCCLVSRANGRGFATDHLERDYLL